jgi:type I restriction-modification system DNA methylase subunit
MTIKLFLLILIRILRCIKAAGQDILGDIYTGLISNFAAAAGKKGMRFAHHLKFQN